MFLSRSEILRAFLLRTFLISALAFGAFLIAFFSTPTASAEDLSCTGAQLEGATVSQDYQAELAREVSEALSGSQHLTPALGGERVELRAVLVGMARLERDAPATRDRVAWDRAVASLRSQILTAVRDGSKLSQLFLRRAELKDRVESCLRGNDSLDGNRLTQRFEKTLPVSSGALPGQQLSSAKRKAN